MSFSADEVMKQFNAWFSEAAGHAGIADPTAACLATADGAGRPSARIVLVKEFDARGFVFYTNHEGRKSQDIKANPRAALCYYWTPLGRQVRVEGPVEPVDPEQADKYFAGRPRESQIGAWASQQSRPLESRDVLMRHFQEQEKRFEGHDIARPTHWSGWRIRPEVIEYWQEGAHRLHDRDVYRRNGSGSFDLTKLYP